MTRRSSPVETALTSRVQFPSALFSLEYDEVFPYEGFAHNLLRHAVDALQARDLPPNISIDFAGLLEGQYPWTLNSSITVGTDSSGHATSFRFVTPELVPAIIYQLVAAVLFDFFDANEFRAKGNAVLSFQADAKNPLEPQSITPGIRADLNVTVPQNGSSVMTVGRLSRTPSFELNVWTEGGAGLNIPLQSEPSGMSFGLGLFQNNLILNFTPLPPPPPPCAQSKQEKLCNN